MHIEPGIVTGAKLALSAVTAAGAGLYTAKLAWNELKERNVASLAARTVASTALVFCFFQVLPHYPVGVSEVHLILGSTLFLILGAAPAAFGLALGLLLQGLFFAPFDLLQYGMNVTTLLVPLFGLQYLAKKIIAPNTAYVDLQYSQALALSTAYQGGVVVFRVSDRIFAVADAPGAVDLFNNGQDVKGLLNQLSFRNKPALMG